MRVGDGRQVRLFGRSERVVEGWGGTGVRGEERGRLSVLSRFNVNVVAQSLEGIVQMSR